MEHPSLLNILSVFAALWAVVLGWKCIPPLDPFESRVAKLDLGRRPANWFSNPAVRSPFSKLSSLEVQTELLNPIRLAYLARAFQNTTCKDTSSACYSSPDSRCSTTFPPATFVSLLKRCQIAHRMHFRQVCRCWMRRWSGHQRPCQAIWLQHGGRRRARKGHRVGAGPSSFGRGQRGSQPGEGGQWNGCKLQRGFCILAAVGGSQCRWVGVPSPSCCSLHTLKQ